jgi:hypothetical protein
MMPMLDRIVVALVLASSVAAGCGTKDSSPDASIASDSGALDRSTATADAGRDGASEDADSADDTATNPDAGEEDATVPDGGRPITLLEQEPNDGTTVDEVNELPVGTPMSGSIGVDDTDIFATPTEAGKLYTVNLTVERGSQLQPHLTVMDDGRDGDRAGADYTKIVRGTSIQFLAMGDGGHLVVVRDSRNVDEGGVGGDDFGYLLEVSEAEAATAVQSSVDFGMSLQGTLARPGDVHLWSFDGTEGTDVQFDMQAPDGDGRLYVFATETGSWIARQDDRTVGDPDPLLDAFLTASGPMYLVVENIAEEVGDIAYTIETSSSQ